MLVDPSSQIAEEKILEAMAEGEFDNLPGRGEALDLDGYFATPEGWRMGLSVLRSAGVVPEEIEFLREMQECRERLESGTEVEKEQARRRLAELASAYEMKMQRFREQGSTTRVG